MSGMVEKLGQSNEGRVGIERAMILVGNLLHEIYKMKKGVVKFLVAPFNPRNSPDYSVYTSVATVMRISLVVFASIFNVVNLSCFPAKSD
jgi:hypothetical protein